MSTALRWFVLSLNIFWKKPYLIALCSSAYQVLFGHSHLPLSKQHSTWVLVERLAMGSRQRLLEMATVIISAQVGSSTNQFEDGLWLHLWCHSSTGLDRPSFCCLQRFITPSFQETLKNIFAMVIISAQVGNSTNQFEDGLWSHLWCRSSTGLDRPSLSFLIMMILMYLFCKHCNQH